MKNKHLLPSVILCLVSLSWFSCKEEKKVTQNPASGTCKIQKFAFDNNRSHNYKYDLEQLVQIKDDQGDPNFIITIDFLYTNGKLTSKIWRAGINDTSYMLYGFDGMLEAQVSYFEGELTDSISFVWNADGTIKAILNVSEGSGTFFTYQIGELKEAIWIIDDNLDGKLNETDDSYEKYTYVVDNKLNPYYGLYIYETDYSQPLDETLFSRTFTKHNVISVTWTDGIDAETSTIKHTYNEKGYPIRSILTYPGGSDIATHTLMCK